ncbi:MAG: hypothetical protein GY705_10485 [Bacteroidetes bacterium]|nr:hypothetical protein [Bacteroidota bacterium]
MHINQSVSIYPDNYSLKGGDSLNTPVIIIEGENIVVDFQGATLVGMEDKKHPDQFKGVGVLIKNGKNITLKNAKVHGFKVALMAESVDIQRILDCDFSYNYRQKLKSQREQEDLSDWLSYHHNENDEWLR